MRALSVYCKCVFVRVCLRGERERVAQDNVCMTEKMERQISRCAFLCQVVVRNWVHLDDTDAKRGEMEWDNRWGIPAIKSCGSRVKSRQLIAIHFVSQWGKYPHYINRLCNQCLCMIKLLFRQLNHHWHTETECAQYFWKTFIKFRGFFIARIHFFATWDNISFSSEEHQSHQLF